MGRKDMEFIMDFKSSETKLNLMRAFSGESQARNRYDFAAELANEQKNYVAEAIFKFTAGQEHAHAKVFYEHLKELNGETVEFCGGYPINVTNSLAELVDFAVHNEYGEYNDVYKNFAKTAKEEGFVSVAASFEAIAPIEKLHGDRFKKLSELMKENMLFKFGDKCVWMCLNCGHVHVGSAVPPNCPVCSHDKGYFIRFEDAPYSADLRIAE